MGGGGSRGTSLNDTHVDQNAKTFNCCCCCFNANNETVIYFSRVQSCGRSTVADRTEKCKSLFSVIAAQQCCPQTHSAKSLQHCSSAYRTVSSTSSRRSPSVQHVWSFCLRSVFVQSLTNSEVSPINDPKHVLFAVETDTLIRHVALCCDVTLQHHNSRVKAGIANAMLIPKRP